jgi:hypothetical protein
MQRGGIRIDRGREEREMEIERPKESRESKRGTGRDFGRRKGEGGNYAPKRTKDRGGRLCTREGGMKDANERERERERGKMKDELCTKRKKERGEKFCPKEREKEGEETAT